MMTGTSGRAAFAFGKSLEAAHAGHVDVGQDQNQGFACGIADALQGAIRRLRKIHFEAVVAQIAPELLAKQHLDIGLVVNNENKEAHEFAPDLLGAALRGSVTLNSVNSPG
jgi:hypothetical protein